MNIRVVFFFGIFFSMGHSLQAMESDSWLQWIKKKIIGSDNLIKEDNKENEKFPWYKLPNELKWKIAQMGSNDSLLEEVSSKMQMKLIKIDDIDLSECDTAISAMSPDSKVFAIASQDLKSVKFLDVKKKLFLDKQSIRIDGQLKSLSWHPNKNKIAIGTASHQKESDRVEVWNLNTNKTEKNIDYTDLKGIEWYFDGNFLFLYGGKGIDRWIGDSLQQETKNSHNLIKCSSDDEWLISCREDGNPEYEQISLCNYKRQSEVDLKNLDGGKLPIQAVDWSDSKFAIGLESGSVLLLDTKSNGSLVIFKYCEEHKDCENGCICNKEQVIDVKFHPSRNVIASAYKSGNIQLSSFDEDKSILEEDLFSKKYRFEPVDTKSIPMPYKIRKIFWLKKGLVLSVLSKDRLTHYAYDSNLSKLLMKRYCILDKTSELRKTSLDPLKLYMAARRLVLVKQIETKDSIVLPDRLEKLGFQKQEIEELIKKKKAVLIGSEEYDYCLFLKERGFAFNESIIGLKGRDVCLEDFLKQNPELDIYKNN